jgi:hypothetical protein
VGIALHRTLIYATGGLAYANIDNVYAVTLPAPNVLGIAGGTYSETGANKDHWGWTVGGGIEDNFWGNLTGSDRVPLHPVRALRERLSVPGERWLCLAGAARARLPDRRKL